MTLPGRYITAEPPRNPEGLLGHCFQVESFMENLYVVSSGPEKNTVSAFQTKPCGYQFWRCGLLRSVQWLAPGSKTSGVRAYCTPITKATWPVSAGACGA